MSEKVGDFLQCCYHFFKCVFNLVIFFPQIQIQVEGGNEIKICLLRTYLQFSLK